MMKQDTHQFAFYTEQVRHIVQHASHIDIHEIDDPMLIKRITNILRLKVGDIIILFDSHYNLECSIFSLNSEKVTVRLSKVEHNMPLAPKIVWLLPLLKREAFEEALYTLTELGVQAIQPVITAKTHRDVLSEKELTRYHKIMIAAAEQSKQYIIPEFRPLANLDLILKKLDKNNTKIFFDIGGSPILTVLEALKIEHAQEINILNGPEGDLTQEEKVNLAAQNFIFCSLTKTVLRAQQSITVGLGIFRSLI